MTKGFYFLNEARPVCTCGHFPEGHVMAKQGKKDFHICATFRCDCTYYEETTTHVGLQSTDTRPA